MSCKQKKIKVNLQLDLDASILPAVNQRFYHQHDHCFKNRLNKPSRIRRRKKLALSRQATDVAREASTQHSHAHEEIAFEERETDLSRSKQNQNILFYDGTQLEFDTRHPESFEALDVDVVFGSPTTTSYTALEDNVYCENDVVSDSVLMVDHDPPLKMPTTCATQKVTTNDDVNASKSGLDVLTLEDFKRILGDFKLDFSLLPT